MFERGTPYWSWGVFCGVVLVLGGNDGGGIQIGVPTMVESTGVGERVNKRESARTGQSVVLAANLRVFLYASRMGVDL